MHLCCTVVVAIVADADAVAASGGFAGLASLTQAAFLLSLRLRPYLWF